eukprot:2195972-Pleurochrysis_carterae.AAC.1
MKSCECVMAEFLSSSNAGIRDDAARRPSKRRHASPNRRPLKDQLQPAKLRLSGLSVAMIRRMCVHVLAAARARTEASEPWSRLASIVLVG